MSLLPLALLAYGLSPLGAGLVAWIRRPRRPPTGGSDPLLLLRPCAGAEPTLERCLGSLPRGLRGPLHVRFVTAAPGDAAEPAIQAAISRLRAAGHRAELVHGPPLGPNRKLSQLHAGLQGTSEPVVLCADSDVDLGSLELPALLGGLQAGLAACWAPPTERTGPGLGDRLSEAVLGGSLHAFPLLCGVDPGGMVGKCFALRREALDAVGGLLPLVETLGEDMELAARLRSRGLPVGPAATLAHSLARDRRPADVLARLSRWILVIRAQRPALLPSYPLLLASSPLAILLALLAGQPSIALVTLLARLLLAALARRRCGLPLRPGPLLLATLAADPVLLMAWALALARRELVWRGQRMRIDPRGRLRPLARA